MKAEEIKLGFKKVSEVHIALNIVSILQGELGKGDSSIVSARSSIAPAVENYNKAISVYQSIIPKANQYLDMAKALGDAGIQKQLDTILKDANSMIKVCNTAITKLKSV